MMQDNQLCLAATARGCTMTQISSTIRGYITKLLAENRNVVDPTPEYRHVVRHVRFLIMILQQVS